MSVQVRDFFDGKSVLITGATGFLGQAFLHKLLSLPCPPRHIFVIVREKRGVEPQKRLQMLFQGTIFDSLRQQHEEKIGKLVQLIPGDLSNADLGLSTKDRELLCRTVSVVVHSAATVRFDDAMTRSVAMNLEATRGMLNLAKNMPNLESFVHISTAYSHCNRRSTQKIEEEFYPVGGSVGPDEMSALLHDMDHFKMLDTEQETKRLIGDRPNTYTFTKALAEELICQENGNLPISIVRPSIVIAAIKDPAPGWITNLNGPTGAWLLAGAGTGLLRTLYIQRDLVADIVPVDVVINLLCAVAANPPKSETEHGGRVPIYNCTTGQRNPITWADIEKWGLSQLRNYPMQDMYWYPCGSFKTSRWMDILCQWLYHYIPAYACDLVRLLILRKPVLFVPLYTKMARAMQALQFFTLREWQWTDENTRSLWKALDEEDKSLFNFDVDTIHWPEYITQYILGTRHYVLKGSPETLPQSRRKLTYFRIVHLSLQLLFAYVLCHIAWIFFSPFFI